MEDADDQGAAGAESPAPRSGVCILRRRGDALDAQAVAPLLMQGLGLARFDAVEACKRPDGILADNVDAAAAAGLVAHLRGLGEDCIIVPAADLAPLPPRQVVHSASLTKTTASFTDAAGHTTEADWSRGAALVLGSVLLEESEMRMVPTPLLKRPGVWGMVTVRTKEEELHIGRKPETLVDVAFLDPLAGYRIFGRHFDYAFLGDQLQPSWEANVLALARWFVYAMPQARTNFDADELMKTGRVQVPSYESPAIGRVSRWLLNLALHDKPGT